MSFFLGYNVYEVLFYFMILDGKLVEDNVIVSVNMGLIFFYVFDFFFGDFRILI